MAAQARPSRVLFWGDRDPFPPKKWIVPHFIAAGEVVGLIGDPFAGKSLFATALTASVAGGGGFFDQQIATGSVVYVAAERARVTWSRLSTIGGDLRLALWRGPVRLGEKREVDDLLAAIDQTSSQFKSPTRLVVIDTLSRCAAGLDENSASDASLLVEAIQRIADTGPAVLVLHHTAKGDARSVRGSSVLTGAFDAVARISIKGERRIARLIQTIPSEKVADATDISGNVADTSAMNSDHADGLALVGDGRASEALDGDLNEDITEAVEPAVDRDRAAALRALSMLDVTGDVDLRGLLVVCARGRRSPSKAWPQSPP